MTKPPKYFVVFKAYGRMHVIVFDRMTADKCIYRLLDIFRDIQSGYHNVGADSKAIRDAIDDERRHINDQ